MGGRIVTDRSAGLRQKERCAGIAESRVRGGERSTLDVVLRPRRERRVDL
jgi:hypothetical protein